MYNSDMPSREELPTTAQLLKSTAIAAVAATAILVTIVLPSEYAVDPTGIGRTLGLTQMGEIKMQLAREAADDRSRDTAPAPAPRSSIGGFILASIIGTAHAQTAERTDETVIPLKPGEGVEWKMTAPNGTAIRYSWRSEGGPINYDMHGTRAGGGRETSYKTARGVAFDEGVLTAGFDGSHGWFFRNRTSQPVTVTLRTTGAYTNLRPMR
ncbi:transmembrane anchor protein [Phreatobacter oligotrophus]|jgi:hypothetical protein|uniref:Transmembrane anchor protein n=1 Tax=Phreatobacter oligotrophus TaxID=1122261 RepID=A0A2T4YWQ1_9HYPH|nr:transmembrane anchor protein [Phreatobacter oligotrophus]PTM49050.1 hypothetical protein C8P69_1213 [Phreatobacter oligotrophus]